MSLIFTQNPVPNGKKSVEGPLCFLFLPAHSVHCAYTLIHCVAKSPLLYLQFAMCIPLSYSSSL